jgi:hypothetical protein
MYPTHHADLIDKTYVGVPGCPEVKVEILTRLQCGFKSALNLCNLSAYQKGPGNTAILFSQK